MNRDSWHDHKKGHHHHRRHRRGDNHGPQDHLWYEALQDAYFVPVFGDTNVKRVNTKTAHQVSQQEQQRQRLQPVQEEKPSVPCSSTDCGNTQQRRGGGGGGGGGHCNHRSLDTTTTTTNRRTKSESLLTNRTSAHRHKRHHHHTHDPASAQQRSMSCSSDLRHNQQSTNTAPTGDQKWWLEFVHLDEVDPEMKQRLLNPTNNHQRTMSSSSYCVQSVVLTKSIQKPILSVNTQYSDSLNDMPCRRTSSSWWVVESPTHVVVDLSQISSSSPSFTMPCCWKQQELEHHQMLGGEKEGTLEEQSETTIESCAAFSQSDAEQPWWQQQQQQQQQLRIQSEECHRLQHEHQSTLPTIVSPTTVSRHKLNREELLSWLESPPFHEALRMTETPTTTTTTTMVPTIVDYPAPPPLTSTRNRKPTSYPKENQITKTTATTITTASSTSSKSIGTPKAVAKS